MKGEEGYSIYHTLHIRRKKDLKIIRDEIGIACEEKQRKLRDYLERLNLGGPSKNLEEVSET